MTERSFINYIQQLQWDNEWNFESLAYQYFLKHSHNVSLENQNKILKNQRDGVETLTSLRWTDDHNRTEGAIAFIIINTNFDFKGCERGDTFISVNEFWSLRRCHHLLLPATCSVGSESHYVAEAFPILKFFWYWLKKDSTVNDQQNSWLRNSSS